MTPMTPERYATLMRLFGEARSSPLAERAAFIARVRESDSDMASELESLLAEASAPSVPRIRPITIARALGPRLNGDDPIIAILVEVLGNDYDSFELLDSGGMGIVYRARQIALDLPVAIKVLRQDLAEDSIAAVERFRREARILATLNHPGMIHMFQYGEAGGIWYFVMDYVPGETLATRLRLEGAVPPMQVRSTLLELADALQYAHLNGVIHRDIKSANILLANGDVTRPKLADFGIARIKGTTRTLTSPRSVVGTLNYMSPEQLVAEPDIDERSDIFSLGLVGYAMLTGREPFAGIENLAVWRMTNDPEPLAKVAPGVPSELAAVIMRCLRRDRESRFPDAQALQEALARTDGVYEPDLIPVIAGFGQYAVLWAIIWTALAVAATDTLQNRALLLLLAAMVPLGLVLHIRSSDLGSLPYGQLARIACWPPEWWGMWWPPVIRRRDDLWPRLPWQGQLTRAILSLFFVAIPVLILVEPSDDGRSAWWDAIKYSLLGVTILVVVGAALWTRAKGLPFPDAFRVLFGSTMKSSAWDVKHVAQLLAPVRGVRPPIPDDPSDWVRAIDELTPVIPAAFAHLGATANVRAHRLNRAIGTCDKTMAGYGRYANDTEAARLDQEIEDIEGQIANGGSEKLRDLLIAVQARREAVMGVRVERVRMEREREGLFELLRELYSALTKLHHRPVGTPVEGPDPADVVRSLCEEINRVLKISDFASPFAQGKDADADPRAP